MISPEKKTIADILKSTRNTYSIPNYQRNFDWGKTELQELIDDIRDTAKQDEKDLFLGNFIFNTSDPNNYEIVDGQQRLTTISIILIALRECAKKINEKEFAGELQTYITASSSWDSKKGNKIVVSPNIRDTFEFISQIEWNGNWPEKIDGNSVKRQNNKLKPIFKYILNELSTYNLEQLKKFTQALMYSYVVVINVESDLDVFSIFERTNARGLDLNIGDLLKNYLYSSREDQYQERWREIILNAQGQLQRLLKYFWVSRKGYSLQSSLYRNFKNYSSEIGIDQFVTELYSFSRYYKVTQSPDSEEVREWLEELELNEFSTSEDHYQSVTRVLQALKFFRVTQAYPLIYSIFIAYRNSSHDSSSRSHKNLIRALESIEKFHFVNNVIATRVGNEIEKLYAEKAQYFYSSDGNFINDINSLIKELKNKKAPKGEFIEVFKETVNYKDTALINYVYDRINNYEAKGGQRIEIFNTEKDLKRRNYNIEHILPQNDRKLYSDEKELELFDTIGNLIILPSHSNSSFQNLSPKEKYELMVSDSKYIGNLRYLTELLKEHKEEFTNWNFQMIKTRTDKVAEDSYDRVWNF